MWAHGLHSISALFLSRPIHLLKAGMLKQALSRGLKQGPGMALSVKHLMHEPAELSLDNQSHMSWSWQHMSVALALGSGDKRLSRNGWPASPGDR